VADGPIRLAVWSGPRNLSTALMRSFEARGDTAVSDEPLYAAYLAATGLDHPMRDAVLASQPTDWRRVVERLATGRPTAREGGDRAIWYAKHMAHHLLPGMLDAPDWLRPMRHALLIRHPARVIASYTAKRGACTPEDLGVPQQVALLDHLTATGQRVVVVDSADVRRDPERALTALCGALGVAFLPAMLRWPAGPRASDGVWGAHWYDGVRASTGFAGPESAGLPEVPDRFRGVLDAVLPHWVRLRSACLSVVGD
jgi:hypothetical protein